MKLKRLIHAARRSPALTRGLFGVQVPIKTRQAHWDRTTLVLRRALDRHIRDGMRVLEIGVGEAALLAVYVARRRRVQVVASDIREKAVVSAREVVRHNGVTIDLRQSDLFSAIAPDETFDVVFFNPPYVPTHVGERRATGEDREVWDGGKDGRRVIDRFLEQAPGRMDGSTRVLLGFNTRHVGRHGVIEKAAECGLRCESVVRSAGNPSEVCVLRKAIGPTAH
jgi:release factor glutamine methyltransferase